MTEHKIDLSTAPPLSLWKTRDGRKAVFGCWNPDRNEGVGWVNGQIIRWFKNGSSYGEHHLLTIEGPWPKEPVVFETTVKCTYEGVLQNRIGFVANGSLLNELIDKRVKVTLEELP